MSEEYMLAVSGMGWRRLSPPSIIAEKPFYVQLTNFQYDKNK